VAPEQEAGRSASHDTHSARIDLRSRVKASRRNTVLLPLFYQIPPSYEDLAGSRFVRFLDLSLG
jgi:hypothetical protein